jgi:2-hydroxy-3-keto-5-methylthiopentenyl-1-phosphate phosphatase
MLIATDFDGTIVTHEYPKIGKEIPFATETLRMLINEHNRIILWTVREGKLLDEAVEWCKERGVEFYAINKDYPEEDVLHLAPGYSRKIKADVFIDDRNLGGIPDWGTIYQMIHSRNAHKPWTNDSVIYPEQNRKKGFFSRLFNK